jgi:hypothetical protein
MRYQTSVWYNLAGRREVVDVAALLTPGERQHYAQGWSRRQKARKAALDRAREEALRKVQAAARVAREKYGVRRAVLFGSLARGTFTEGSDVDLCVEGLEDQGLYYPLYTDLERELLPLRLHLVLWEDLAGDLTGGEELRREIEARGVPL